MNKHYINNCLRWLINEMAPFYQQGQLPEEFNKKVTKFYECVKNAIDWENLTYKDVKRLGLISWEEDEDLAKDGVWFIPMWLYPAIPEGTPLFDKDGKVFNFCSNSANKDSMYGFLTFGVKIKEELTDDGHTIE